MTALPHLQPRYHVRPTRGWVNDPNGPIVVDGVVHLFFQYRPDLTPGSPVEWGHASSTDWVRWTVHESAMDRTIHPAAADGVWSGNTVATADGIRAYFSGFRGGHRYQSIVSADSSDNGMTFGSARLAVDDPADAEAVDQFRDPFVWRDGDHWQLVVGAGSTDGTPAIRHYRSDDGIDWHRGPDLLRAPAADRSPYGFMWECPQVLRSGGQEAVLVSVMDHAVNGFGPVLCLSYGHHDDGNPRIVSTSRVDLGPDFYAASVLPTTTGGIGWGWITEAREEDWWSADGWAGMLSLPRRFELDHDGRLRSAPLPELELLRESSVPQRASKIDGVPAQFEFALTLAPDRRQQLILLTTGDREHTSITVDHDDHRIIVDRRGTSRDHRAAGGVIELPLGAAAGDLRGFVDGSVVELFLPDGTAATVRIYPTGPPPWRLSSPADEVSVWALRSTVITDGRQHDGP